MKAGEPGLQGEQVEGRRAVLELLRAGRRPVRAIYVNRNADPDAVLDEIVERAGSKLESVPAERIATIARSDAPQGVVARAGPLPSTHIDDLIDAPGAFLVALDGVTDPRNLGAVMRAAETAGVTGVVLPRHRTARLTPAVTKAAAGAIEYVPIVAVAGIPAFLERAARRKMWSVGLDERGEQMIDDLPFATESIVVVLGAEGRGLARLTRERCDARARIPMHGRLASLNVATAAALACHAVARQRAM